MIRRTILPVLVLTLALAACSAQIGVATQSLSVLSGNPVSATPSLFAPTFSDTPIPSVSSASILTLPVLASPALTWIQFQDENNGWGMSVNERGYVLRTVDAGRTWLNATPPETGTFGFSASLTVLNTDTAWVLVPGADFFSGTLYRTSDGGVTWKTNPVPFGGALIHFQNGGTGRALAAWEVGAGSEAVELFQTSDGGVNWVSVYHNESSQVGSSDSLPLAGVKNGMTFLDANTGWVTGSLPEDGEVYLYVTHDGGVSWSQQSLALPTGYAAYQYLLRAPVFFGKDGFLPLMIEMPGKTEFTLYVTHDGGLTWSGDPTDKNKIIKPGLSAFADALNIWSWDGGPVIYLTTDGAQRWESTTATLDLSGRLSRLEFVSAASGRFTGWALTRLDEAGHSQLYRTIDGSTWTPIIP